MHSTIVVQSSLLLFCCCQPQHARLPPSDPPVVHRTLLRFEWVGSPSCRPELDVLEGPAPVSSEPIRTRSWPNSLRSAQVFSSCRMAGCSPVQQGTQRYCRTPAHCTDLCRGCAGCVPRHIAVDPTCLDKGTRRSRIGCPNTRAWQRSSAQGNRRDYAKLRVSIRSSSQLRLRRLGFIAGPGRNVHGQLAVGATAFSGAVPSWSWGMIGRVGVALGAWHVDGQVCG